MHAKCKPYNIVGLSILLPLLQRASMRGIFHGLPACVFKSEINAKRTLKMIDIQTHKVIYLFSLKRSYGDLHFSIYLFGINGLFKVNVSL